MELEKIDAMISFMEQESHTMGDHFAQCAAMLTKMRSLVSITRPQMEKHEDTMEYFLAKRRKRIISRFCTEPVPLEYCLCECVRDADSSELENWLVDNIDPVFRYLTIDSFLEWVWDLSEDDNGIALDVDARLGA